MAVRIIEGVPGAGKTYFAVHHLLASYFDWNDTTDEFKPKPDFAGLLIISNIDGFPYSVSLTDLIDQHGGIEGFFTYEKQASLFQDRKVIYLIDEAQGLFPYKFYGPRVFLFFQKHRHLGMDIYLITQDAEHMAKGLRSLAEYHIKAVRRSLSLMGEFRYHYADPTTGEVWRRKTLKRDRRIFAFYRSMESQETEKHKSVPLHFIAIAGGLFVVAALIFGWRVLGWGGSGDAFSRSFLSHNPDQAISAGKQAHGKTGSVANKGGSKSLPEKADAVQRLPAQAGTPPAPARLNRARVVGTFQTEDSVLFLAHFEGNLYRLSPDEMTRACRCHAELLKAGFTFDFDTSADAGFFYSSPITQEGDGRARGAHVPLPYSGTERSKVNQ